MKKNQLKNNLMLSLLAIITGYFSYPLTFIRAQTTILPPGKPEEWDLKTTVPQMIANVTDIALSVAGIVATIFIIIGGINYLTAYGSEEKATAGKTTMGWAIAGLVLIILSKVVIATLWRFIAKGTPPF